MCGYSSTHTLPMQTEAMGSVWVLQLSYTVQLAKAAQILRRKTPLKG